MLSRTEQARTKGQRLALSPALFCGAAALLSLTQPSMGIELPFGPRNVAFAGASSDSAYCVSALDMNRDDRLDLVGVVGKSVILCTNNGRSPVGFGASSLVTGLSGAHAVSQVMDIDGDGDMDVAVADAGNTSINWYENLGTANTYFPKRYVDTPSGSYDDAVTVLGADFNGDHHNDLLAAYHSSLLWYENYPTVPPAFTKHSLATVSGAAPHACVADMNDDDLVDVVASYNGGIVLYQNSSPGAAFTANTISTTGGGLLVAADVDKDGRTDLVSSNLWYRNNGGSAPSFTAYPIGTFAPTDVFPVDLDRDGDVDLVACNNSSIAWLENTGERPPVFVTHTIDTTGAEAVCAADLDGDGDREIIAASGNALAYYENKAGLRIKSAHFVDASGDGIHQPGESGQLLVEMENSAAGLSDVAVVVTSSSLPLRFASNSVAVGSVPAGSSRTVSVPYTTPAAAECGSQLSAKVRLTWSDGHRATPEFTAAPASLGALEPSDLTLEDTTPAGQSGISRTLSASAADGLTSRVRVTFTVSEIFSSLGTTVTLRAPGMAPAVLYQASAEASVPGVPPRYYSITQNAEILTPSFPPTNGDYVLSVEKSGKIDNWKLQIDYGTFSCTPVVTVDLGLVQTATPNPVIVGSNLTCSLSVTNSGSAAATGVTLTDALPSGLVFVGAGSSQGSVSESNGTVTAQLGTIDSGASANVSITLLAPQAGTFTNTVSVSENEMDLNPADNSAALTVTAQPPSTADLTGSWARLSQNCRTKRGALRCQLQGKFSLQNVGTATAAASALCFYLSDDASLDAADQLLRQASMGTMRTGRPKGVSLSLQLASGASASGKYVIAVVDAAGQVNESNEANNTIVYGPLP